MPYSTKYKRKQTYYENSIRIGSKFAPCIRYFSLLVSPWNSLWCWSLFLIRILSKWFAVRCSAVENEGRKTKIHLHICNGCLIAKPLKLLKQNRRQCHTCHSYFQLSSGAAALAAFWTYYSPSWKLKCTERLMNQIEASHVKCLTVVVFVASCFVLFLSLCVSLLEPGTPSSWVLFYFIPPSKLEIKWRVFSVHFHPLFLSHSHFLFSLCFTFFLYLFNDFHIFLRIRQKSILS